MDWSLVIFVAIVLLMGYRGYRNGLLKSIARISSILVGYICAFLFSGQVASLVESNSGIQGIAAFAIASLLLFFGAAAIVGLCFRLIAKLWVKQEALSTASSVGGAVIGTLTGILIAVLVVWAFTFLRGLQADPDTETAQPSPPSSIENLAGKVASEALNTAMSLGSASPEITRISSALFEAPADILRQVQRLSRDPDLLMLLTRPENRKALNSGDYRAVQRLEDFQKLARNPHMIEFMESTRLLEMAESDNRDPEDALAIQLSDVWMRTQRVKNDTRVQEILNDPEFRQNMLSGNPVSMLTDSQLLELADIIFSDEAAADREPGNAETHTQNQVGETAKPVKPQKIYQWTDENGDVHFSNVDPDS